MNDVMHYRVKLSDIDNKNLNETMYFDKLNNRDKWFEVSLITDDLFTLDSIQLYSDDKVKIVSGDNLQAYQFEGKHRLNMNDFKLINKIKVSHFLGN